MVQKVNEMIATGQYGRLFAVVHFASKQYKITSEDLIMMDNVLQAECGDRIRMEKVTCIVHSACDPHAVSSANVSWGKIHNQFLKSPEELLLGLPFLFSAFFFLGLSFIPIWAVLLALTLMWFLLNMVGMSCDRLS